MIRFGEQAFEMEAESEAELGAPLSARALMLRVRLDLGQKRRVLQVPQLREYERVLVISGSAA